MRISKVYYRKVDKNLVPYGEVLCAFPTNLAQWIRDNNRSIRVLRANMKRVKKEENHA